MDDIPRPRILILQADDTTRAHTQDLLQSQEWDIICESVSKDALARLKQSGPHPFHLFISNYNLPKMQGDDILKQAKAISPMTQRMMTVPSDRPDMVIRAINKAELNACIVTPATDTAILNKVRACIRQFGLDMKREQLRRVVTHQNKQLLTIARRLKQRDDRCKARITARKKEKARLAALLARINRQKKDPATLEDRIIHHNIDMTPESLGNDFHQLAHYINALFCHIAQTSQLATPFSPIKDIIAAPIKPSDPLNASPEKDDLTGHEIIRQVMRTAFSCPHCPPIEGPQTHQIVHVPQDIGDLIDIQLSKDKVRAFIQLKTAADPKRLNLDDLLNVLQRHKIRFGIVDDEVLETWLSAPDKAPFMVAEGDAPVPGVPGDVFYQFKINYTNPGKLMDDGRIDFRDRGAIPFVTKGDLLAVKTPSQKGKNGMSVYGDVIEVADVLDPVMIPGNGTRLSEDECCIFADVDGQPHLNPQGEVSVNPELPIKGDVDYETGNIHFNGNIVVNGTIKDGFQVNGVTLTAKEIEGGIIDLSGDLYVTDGITDAQIVSVGNIHARFINNSTINAFGNVTVQKEILDSDITISGGIENARGVIMSSKISAKAGVNAGRLGTDSSTPSQVRVGIDDHLNHRIQAIETRLEAGSKRLAELKTKIDQIEAEDLALYRRITENAQKQEHLQKRIQRHLSDRAHCPPAQDPVQTDPRVKEKATLVATLKRTEAALNRIFHIQATHAKTIEVCKNSIKQVESDNKRLILRRNGLIEYSQKIAACPRVTVNKSITQDTVVTGPNASVTLQLDLKRCRIEEKCIEEKGGRNFKMEIIDQFK